MPVSGRRALSRDTAGCRWISIPERQFGPVPFWAWLGDMSPDTIDRHLKRFRAMEVFELIVFPLYGLTPEYLGREYFRLYRHACRRCREWGLTLWVYDEFNWPSGTCAGRVLRDFPEARLQCLQYDWPQPDYRGQPQWKIVEYARANLAAYGAPWALNTAGCLDTLNPAAVRHYLDMTHEVYRRELGDYFGDVIVGFFTDEPVFGHGGRQLPYTPGLFEQFKNRYGYDLRPHLAELIAPRSRNLRARQDYWNWVIERLQTAFYRQYAAWCGAQGLRMTGHLLFEEIVSGLAYNGDPYAMLSEMQTPGIDVLDGATSFDRRGRFKCFGDESCLDVTGQLIESVAYFGGKERALCEAFGCMPNSATAQSYKRAADFVLHHGVSLVNDNLFADSLGSFRKFCGCHALRTPWVEHYPLLARHIRTLSWLNAGSRVMTRVGVYYPGVDTRLRYTLPGAMFAGPHYADSDWETTQQILLRLSHGLIRRQWNYYYLFDQVLRQARIGPGILRIRDFECRVLILPGIRYLSEDVAGILRRFVERGGHILCVGRLPTIVSAQGAVCPGRWRPSDRVVEIRSSLDEVVAEVVRRLETLAQRDVALRGDGIQNVMLTHRMARGRELLFLTNFGEDVAEVEILAKPGWAHLDTASRVLEGPAQLKERLRPNESIVLVRASVPAARVPSGPTIDLSHNWTLRLPEGNVLSLPVRIFNGPMTQRMPRQADDSSWTAPCAEFPPLDLVPGQSYWLRREIVLVHKPRHLELVVDGEDRCEVYWNGRRMALEHNRQIWDDDNRSCDLRKTARLGANELTIRYSPAAIRAYVTRMVPLADLPPFVLVGDFAVEWNVGRKNTRLVPRSGGVRLGSLLEQGYPDFVGRAEYATTVRLKSADSRAILDLGRQNDLFEVRVNHRPAGILAWPPYRVEVGSLLKRGVNRIELGLHSALGGILARHYSNIEKEKPPLGLLDLPRLIGCRTAGDKQ